MIGIPEKKKENILQGVKKSIAQINFNYMVSRKSINSMPRLKGNKSMLISLNSKIFEITQKEIIKQIL